MYLIFGRNLPCFRDVVSAHQVLGHSALRENIRALLRVLSCDEGVSSATNTFKTINILFEYIKTRNDHRSNAGM